MSENKEHSKSEYSLRAKLPLYFRYAAVGMLGLTLLAVIAGFYRERGKTQFKLKGEHSQLSTDVIAEVSGYDRLETDGGVSKYYIKADYAKTFSDNHQELDNVYVRTYDKEGNAADTMTAQKALYIPEADKNFTAYLNGDVYIETRDSLKVKTNNITYSKANEVADADEFIEFERGNVHGKSLGATIKMAEKRLELLKNVEIETFDSPELAKSGVHYAKINADSASFDQNTNKIDLNSNVAINIQSKSSLSGGARSIDAHAGRASVDFVLDSDSGSGTNGQVKKFEMFDAVHIVSAESGAVPTTIDSGDALFDKEANRFELNNGVHIVTSANDKTTDIRASQAVYNQTALKLALSGGVEITQGEDYLKGDTVDADLFADKKVRYAVIRGNGVLRQTVAERTTTVVAPELNAAFNETRQLQAANTIGQSTVQLVPNGDSDYTHLTFSAPIAIHVVFKGLGLIEHVEADGRTTIQMDVPVNRIDAADKRVTADTVRAFFFDDGKNIRRAEAVGNAELYVEPLKSAAANYRTTITAPRFDCDFYPAGNNARVCSAGKKTKTSRVPTVVSEGHGTQTMLADQLNTAFGEKSKDIESLEAVGNAKFTENDRNATASQMTYAKTDETVRLRGGEPTAWDTSSRVKAREIDWDTRNKHSYFRGGVSTTYYSRKKSGDSLPFSSADKPVFVTSETAEFDHSAESAVFSGNARGWQDSNYVRADKLFIKQREGQLFADGTVQSAIYDAKQKVNGKESNVPVFAASRSMTYDRETRLLRYRDNVDIRQGTDRVTAGSADVYLNSKNEVAKTIAETSVVMTQPSCRATGDWVQYTVDDEVAIIRGNPATVNDAENGSSQNGEITVSMRDHRVSAQGRSKQNAGGRSRSVYKVKVQ